MHWDTKKDEMLGNMTLVFQQTFSSPKRKMQRMNLKKWPDYVTEDCAKYKTAMTTFESRKCELSRETRQLSSHF